MQNYPGIYILMEKEQPVTILFLKDKMIIGLRDEYWYYDQVVKENFVNHGGAIFRYKGYPPQAIKVNSKEFIARLENILNRKDIPFFGKFFNRTTLVVFKLVTAFVAVIILVYFLLIPVLAVRLANRVPVSYEERIGNDLYNAMKTQFKIDEQKTALVNEFFKELKISSPYNIRITIVNENLANAFAIPGGNIVVYSKIIRGITGYEELAALLSHEFAHIQNKHTTKTLFKKLGSVLVFSIIFGDVGGLGTAILNYTDELQSLSYGRSLEREADEAGLKILSDRKIDGEGFIRLFKLLKKESGVATSEWISSHPDLNKRIRYLKQNENFNKRGILRNDRLQELFLRIKAQPNVSW